MFTVPTPPPIAALTAATAPAQIPAETDAAEAGSKFEAVFLRMLLKEMMPRDGNAFFGKEPGGSIYKDLFAGAIADEMGKAGVLGIKELVDGELRRASGGEQHEPNRGARGASPRREEGRKA